MSNIQKPDRRPLPKIDALYADVELAAKQNDINRLLNCQPKAEWIKQNKFANNSNYIPIAIIEFLLTSIFLKWRVEVKSIQVIANSVVVAVRLHIQDPLTGDWDWQDGIGAAPIQTEKGAGATDFTKVNTLAVQMAAPAAESYAFKDAAEKLGRLFGKDINRENINNYEILDRKLNDVSEITEVLIDVINQTKEPEKLTEIYKNNPEFHTNPKFMQLLNKRKSEINGSTPA